MTQWKTQIAISLGGILGLSVDMLPLAAHRLAPWEGLVHEDVIHALPTNSAVGDDPWRFRVGVLNSFSQFRSFQSVADGELPATPEIDWHMELVLFAIWPFNTNDVNFDSWQSPEDGTGVFSFTHEGIEPFCDEQYPAVLHTVLREGLQRVDFTLSGGSGVEEPISLAVVPVPEPSCFSLAFLALVSLPSIMHRGGRTRKCNVYAAGSRE